MLVGDEVSARPSGWVFMLIVPVLTIADEEALHQTNFGGTDKSNTTNTFNTS